MKFLIADDHVLFRDALKEYLVRYMPDVEAQFYDDFFAVQKALRTGAQADLVILDYHMNGMQGGDALDNLLKECPDLKVVLISGVALAHEVRKMIEKGVVGYFPKTMHGRDLIDGLKSVVNGEIFIPVDVQSRELMPSSHADDAFSHPKRSFEVQHDFDISKKEREVLSLLLQGLSNKEIAKNLFVQEVTIKMHISSICKKLDVKNRTQAALKARELGF